MKTRDHETVSILPAVAQLDLACVIERAANENEWDHDTANMAEHDYRLFLNLVRLYPGRPIVPSDHIDEVWHFHILHTEKYAGDCQAVFGRFQHHHPYFGLPANRRGEPLQNVAATKQLFIETYGELPTSYMLGKVSGICDGGSDCCSGPCNLS